MWNGKENKRYSQWAYKRNTQSRSSNNCSRVKAMSATYFVRVFLALFI